MSRIRNKHSKPEVIIRSLLHKEGFRFLLNVKKLPGCPDIVMPKYKSIIFVHGCFWHRHKNCKRATFPKTNKKYWGEKFEKNIIRHEDVNINLTKLGWKILVLWECEILEDPYLVLSSILSEIGKQKEYCLNSGLKKSQVLQVAEKRSKYLIKKEKKTLNGK